MNQLFAHAGVWLQATPDIRNVSWWLPHGAARDLLWLTVLSLNLAALLYILHKLLFRGKAWSIPGVLRDRGQTIQTQLREAEEAHQAAQTRLAAIEARIANLPAEVASLQAEAEIEAANEYQLLVEESRREAERIAHQGRTEIEAAAKLAQKELKGLAATLALDLAAERIRERLTTAMDEAVVRGALEGMKSHRPN